MLNLRKGGNTVSHHAVHRGGLSLLHKILRVVSGVLARDAAARGEALNGRPYYRIFLGLIAELAPTFPADPEADPTRLSLIAMVAHVLEELQPQRVPGFAFPWLELISHRCAILPDLTSLIPLRLSSPAMLCSSSQSRGPCSGF